MFTSRKFSLNADRSGALSFLKNEGLVNVVFGDSGTVLLSVVVTEKRDEISLKNERGDDTSVPDLLRFDNF